MFKPMHPVLLHQVWPWNRALCTIVNCFNNCLVNGTWFSFSLLAALSVFGGYETAKSNLIICSLSCKSHLEPSVPVDGRIWATVLGRRPTRWCGCRCPAEAVLPTVLFVKSISAFWKSKKREVLSTRRLLYKWVQITTFTIHIIGKDPSLKILAKGGHPTLPTKTRLYHIWSAHLSISCLACFLCAQPECEVST